MPRMVINGETYDVPDSDVVKARTQYGAVPADSMSAPPPDTGQQDGGGPLDNLIGGAAGFGNAALQGLSGLKLPLGIGGGLYGIRFLLNHLRGGNHVKVTRALKDQFPDELRNFKVGDKLSEASLEKIKLTPAKPEPFQSHLSQAEYDLAKLPVTRGGKVKGLENAPPEVQRLAAERGLEPATPVAARAPARMAAESAAPTGTAESRLTVVPGTGARGKSTPQLTREGTARAQATGKAAPATADDLMAQLEASVGAAQNPGVRAALAERVAGQSGAGLRNAIERAAGNNALGAVSLLPAVFPEQTAALEDQYLQTLYGRNPEVLARMRAGHQFLRSLGF